MGTLGWQRRRRRRPIIYHWRWLGSAIIFPSPVILPPSEFSQTRTRNIIQGDDRNNNTVYNIIKVNMKHSTHTIYGHTLSQTIIIIKKLKCIFSKNEIMFWRNFSFGKLIFKNIIYKFFIWRSWLGKVTK